MSDLKTQVQSIDPNLKAREMDKMIDGTTNIYKSLVIISKRARQLNVQLKEELNAKLEEFAVTPDTIEEINENKEQIEISKFYEKLPNPSVIATSEFLDNKLEYRDRDDIVDAPPPPIVTRTREEPRPAPTPEPTAETTPEATAESTPETPAE